METLKERKCVPCEGGVRPHDAKSAGGMMSCCMPTGAWSRTAARSAAI